MMMKFVKTFCIISVLSAIANAGIVRAENAPPLGSFRGGGYAVEVGNGGDYVGRDPQGRKIVIRYDRSHSYGKTTEWSNKGYIYRLTGIGDSLAGASKEVANATDGEDSTDYRRVLLTIVNPQGKTILKQVLNNPSYGKK